MFVAITAGANFKFRSAELVEELLIFNAQEKTQRLSVAVLNFGEAARVAVNTLVVRLPVLFS